VTPAAPGGPLYGLQFNGLFISGDQGRQTDCATLIDGHFRTDTISGVHPCDVTAGQSEHSHGERVHV